MIAAIRWRVALAAATLSIATGSSAQDAATSAADTSLNIAPLRIELDSSSRASLLRVSNPGDSQVAVQIRLFEWTQSDGEDHYKPSTDVTISPAIVSIPARKMQAFRILRRTTASQGEKCYRLIIDQLPPDRLSQTGEALTRLQFSVPIFADRDRAAPASLAWRMLPHKLEVANSGGQTARIANLKVSFAGQLSSAHSGIRYVQGGSSIRWPFSGTCRQGLYTISADVDGKRHDAEVAQTCH